VPFVEAAGAVVLLKHPEVQAAGAELSGLVEQHGPDAAALVGRVDVELLERLPALRA
jgi:hypothetical protein